jgi:Regulator of chromosome condensation (RCC1) repeat
MMNRMMNRSVRFGAAVCSLCLWLFACSDGDLNPDLDAALPVPPDATVALDAAEPDAFVEPPECVQAVTCDDGLYCNGPEVCDPSGTCAPATAAACDDGVACTVETCDEDAKTCARAPSNALCSNGLFCDGAEVCSETGCASGAPPELAPGLSCKNGRVAAGSAHTCALLNGGQVYCWGRSNLGQLGHGNKTPIGDDEGASAGGALNFGGAVVVDIDAGDDHTCALLEGGSVRCWGEGTLGRLGYGNTIKVGDNELPSARGPVDLGGAAVQIAAGGTHTCAVLDTGEVRCWGFGLYGQLGYGNTLNVGDNPGRLPSAAGDVPVGAPVAELVLGDNHSCVRLESRAVRCWGRGDKGELGYGSIDNLGDDEILSLSDVDLGEPTVHLATGATHNCALLEGGAVRCWGNGGDGRLGYGNVTVIGDDETPQSAGNVSLP